MTGRVGDLVLRRGGHRDLGAADGAAVAVVDLAAASIKDSCQVAEPGCDPNVRDVADPDDVGLGRNDVLSYRFRKIGKL